MHDCCVLEYQRESGGSGGRCGGVLWVWGVILIINSISIYTTTIIQHGISLYHYHFIKL